MKITKNINDLNFKCLDCNDYNEGLKIANKLKLVCSFGSNKNAVGLAHNQIKGNKKVYITKYNNKSCHYINAKIIKKSSKSYYTTEGCMSYKKPNKVKRYNWVIIKHLTKNGYIEEKFEGFLASIHQHEIQHLNGIDIHHQKID